MTEGLFFYHFAVPLNRQYMQTIPPSFAAQNPPPFAQGRLESGGDLQYHLLLIIQYNKKFEIEGRIPLIKSESMIL